MLAHWWFSHRFVSFPCVSQADSYVPHSTLILFYNVLEFERKKNVFFGGFVCLFVFNRKGEKGQNGSVQQSAKLKLNREKCMLIHG